MGIIYLISAATLWGLIGPVSKLVFAHGMTPLETAFWRGTIAGVAFYIHWLFKRYDIPKGSREIARIVLFGIFGVALLEGSFVYAVRYGGAALASVLLYSAPIWVNLANVALFREHVPGRRWATLSLTFAGVVGICLWGARAEFSRPAIIWGLLSGVSYACFYIAGKLFFRRTHPVVVYMIAFPVGSLAILPIIFLVSDGSLGMTASHLISFSRETFLACLALGVISTYLPYLLYGAGLMTIDTGRAAIMTMVEPVVSVTLAAIMWGEVFSIPGYLFTAAIMIGIALS